MAKSNAMNNGTGDEPVLPLYKPVDTTVIKLNDNRRINPATGQAFNTVGTKGIKANEEDIRAIIAHAKAKGVDPNTALAIGLQETNLGQLDPNYGSAWATFEDAGLEGRDKYANILAKAVKEKMAYASELRRKGLLPEGEEYDLQTYNGLGVLRPRTTVNGVPQNESYYGIPVTATHSIDLKKNPAYGRTVMQLRDEVIKKNQRIQDLIGSVPAYGVTVSPVPAPSRVKVRVKK